MFNLIITAFIFHVSEKENVCLILKDMKSAMGAYSGDHSDSHSQSIA